MIIQSDWHIHSENSYDATLTLEEIARKAKEFGFKRVGITDHANFNDDKFLWDLKSSANSVRTFQKKYPEMILGVELTPIEKPEFDYIKKHGTRQGYVPPVINEPYALELAQTKDQLIGYGVRYAIGAAHWRVDVPFAKGLPVDIDAMIKEWYRQQLWLACDERVTILGHPWYNGKAVWYDDFSIIPRSMNMDIAYALKENKKYVECNEGVLCSQKASEKFRRQYAEFIRELFEMGIPVTYGSDSHKEYACRHIEMEKILADVGFKKGDFSEIKEKDFWC
ncbi:MAG: PHP domain-containing protein [Ruminococcaceae bacterium]|nr:PHP domain-containing protein [Oscillospiraceae bacterium]